MSASGSAASMNERLEELRAERGDMVSIDEVGEVVSAIMGTMQGDVSSLDLQVYKELDDLAQYIRAAKSEIIDLCPNDIREEHLPDAADQLDAIVSATAEATNTILDAAEIIDAEARSIGAKEINEQVVRMFEACSFQDLTGQRISKVVNTLKHIEAHLDRLVDAFGEEVRRATKPRNGGEKASGKTDADLLNGPELPEKANKQEEIDALLASFD